MLSRLIDFSTRAPAFVVAVALLVVGLVVARLDELRIDVFPELLAPRVLVQTEAAGYGAQDVARLVTRPVEQACLNIPGVLKVRSASRLGLSMVFVEFDWSFDRARARQLVSERMASTMAELPTDVHVEIAPETATSGEILLVALTSADADPIALRSLAEFDLRPALLGVPGVALVTVMGGGLPQIRVEYEWERLATFGLAPQDLVDAASAALATPGLGQLPDVDGRELPLVFDGRVRNARDLALTPLPGAGLTGLALGDVADVRLDAALPRGTASSNGVPAVVVSVQKSPGVNTLALTDAIDAALDRFEARLPSNVSLDRHAIRQVTFIARSIDSLTGKLLEAAVVVIVVLVLLMRDRRTILISLAALPTALAVAIGVLDAFDMAIDVMTLGGLAIALGELVDDAIIDAENVTRRLRGSAARGAERAVIVASASNEVRRAIVFATAILAIVFLPVLALEGLEGRFLVPLAWAYLTAIGASLLVAVTLTPALCVLLLRVRRSDGSAASTAEREPWLLRKIQGAHAFVLERFLRVPRLVLASSLLLGAAALVVASGFGARFLPEFREGSLTVFLSAPPGSSLAAATRLGEAVDVRLSRLDGVASVVRRTGRAERDEHAEPPSNSEIELRIDPDADLLSVRANVERILAELPGVTTMIGQPIEHRLSHVVSGTPADIAVSFLGASDEILRRAGERAATALGELPGVRTATTQRELVTRQIAIDVRPEVLGRLQLSRGDLARQVALAFAGREVGVVVEGLTRLPVVVRMANDKLDDLSDLSAHPIVGANGEVVRFDEVALIGVTTRSNLIQREAGRSKNTVQVELLPGTDPDGAARATEALVAPIAAAEGLDYSLAGQFEAQRRTRSTLAVHGLGVLVLVFFLLRQALRSWSLALLVLVNVPLALLGGVAAVLVTGGASAVLSVSSLIGFVALSGLAIRNGILLVQRVLDLEDEGVETPLAIRRGTRDRLGPILMTALTALGALLPLALAPNQPGTELLAPMAVVVVGGLLTSTLLNLVVVPCGYALVARRSGRNTSPTTST